jgi:hypothetical protein
VPARYGPVDAFPFHPLCEARQTALGPKASSMTRIRDMPLIRTVSVAGEEASPRGDPRTPTACGRRAAMNSIASAEPCGSLLSSHSTHRPELFQTSRVRLRTHA